ncbi:hypothetical protein [Arthrobacter bambusae]|uniref:Uncharacterized protein n=1 Tax=Arthrobacter bambusae TaxID=1338426 RepID=A0AAW8DCV4_9MICC|nr:hypothetical protein [Arthrobacter bambusae]MDP9905618.1 hypothetical protein [Arthrobacter bambusae]MDQ0127300.1 hypothetical protein [Arthrobacter bambusae]MDQ0178642.1 hypothetical protein [Arthrobacter bambusae]
MHNKTKISLGAITLVTMVVITGCSSSSSSSANAVTPSTAASSAASLDSTPTSTPTPDVVHGAGWTSSVTLSKSIPKKWQGGAGWVIPLDTTGTTGQSVYSMKTSIGVLSYSSLKTDAVFTTYDKYGTVIAKSPAPVELSPTGLEAPSVVAISTGGNSYLTVMQSGTFLPDPTSTKSAGLGTVLTSFDVATGKLVTHAAIDRTGPINTISDQAVFTYGPSGDAATRSIFNPVTGKPDIIKDSEWQGRYDGVDVTTPGKDPYYNFATVVAPGWKISNAIINDSPLASGKYINLKIQDPAGNTVKCETLDVHTGKPISIEAQLNNLCMYGVGNIPAPYFGVLSYEDGYGSQVTFANPETGKVVHIAPSDTFKGGFIGGDGVVYGTSSAVQGASTPAYLDLNEGTPKTLGDTTTLGPVAVSGEGVAVFQSTEGLAFINPVAH